MELIELIRKAAENPTKHVEEMERLTRDPAWLKMIRRSLEDAPWRHLWRFRRMIVATVGLDKNLVKLVDEERLQREGELT